MIIPSSTPRAFMDLKASWEQMAKAITLTYNDKHHIIHERCKYERPMFNSISVALCFSHDVKMQHSQYHTGAACMYYVSLTHQCSLSKLLNKDK